jgi:hypothetical protein
VLTFAISLGYVRNNLTSQFLLTGTPVFKPERGFEFNAYLFTGRAAVDVSFMLTSSRGSV